LKIIPESKLRILKLKMQLPDFKTEKIVGSEKETRPRE